MRAVAFLVTAAMVAAAAAESPSVEATPERIARLVAQLGSTRFADREGASKTLDAIGEPALETLRAASTSTDAETRRRARELAERIARRSAMSRLLKPTLVALDIRDKRLDDAVRDLARATGLNLELPKSGQYAGRRVTVRCEPTPVWQAIDLFCSKANLHDWDGFTPHPGQPATANVPGMIQNNIVFGGQGQIQFAGRSGRVNPRGDGKVVLLDGPSAALPVHNAGAVRIRALPPGTPFPLAVMADETVLPLQVSAEPKLQWAAATGLRIDKAVSELGQPLAATGVVVPVTNDDDLEWINLPNGGMMVQQATGKGGPAAVRIARGDTGARRIAELSGEITGSVRVKEEMARIDGPFMAGATANGQSSVVLRLTKVVEEKPGEIRVTLEISVPLEVPAAGIGPLAGRVQIQGMVMQQMVVAGPRNAGSNLPPDTTEYEGVTIEDAQGRRWKAVNGMTNSRRIDPQGTTMQMMITFKAPAADSAASRLTYTGTRPTIVAIPFTLRDLPLF